MNSPQKKITLPWAVFTAPDGCQFVSITTADGHITSRLTPEAAAILAVVPKLLITAKFVMLATADWTGDMKASIEAIRNELGPLSTEMEEGKL